MSLEGSFTHYESTQISSNGPHFSRSFSGLPVSFRKGSPTSLEGQCYDLPTYRGEHQGPERKQHLLGAADRGFGPRWPTNALGNVVPADTQVDGWVPISWGVGGGPRMIRRCQEQPRAQKLWFWAPLK